MIQVPRTPDRLEFLRRFARRTDGPLAIFAVIGRAQRAWPIGEVRPWRRRVIAPAVD
jgi:hypothetical protein